MNYVENKEKLKVLTPNGYKNFAGIAYMGDKKIMRLEFGNKSFLECTENHKLFLSSGEKKEAKDIKIGEWVTCKNLKKTKVKNIIHTDKILPVYDLIEVEDGHRYFTNEVLSSNCEFITDDETLIDSFVLSKLQYKEPEFYLGTIRWYERPAPNNVYLVALDPSMGTENDFASIQVFKLPDMVQIAEWQNNKTNPRGQVKILMQILSFLEYELKNSDEQQNDPDIFWTFENNSLGEAILQIIDDTGEDRFPGVLINEKKKKGQTKRFRKGMTTTNRNKLSACARLKSLIESNRLKINSRNLLKELKNYVAFESSFKAKSGEHDDLISASLLIIRMLDVALMWVDNIDELKEYISDDDISGYDENISGPLPVVL